MASAVLNIDISRVVNTFHEISGKRSPLASPLTISSRFIVEETKEVSHPPSPRLPPSTPRLEINVSRSPSPVGQSIYEVSDQIFTKSDIERIIKSDSIFTHAVKKAFDPPRAGEEMMWRLAIGDFIEVIRSTPPFEGLSDIELCAITEVRYNQMQQLFDTAMGFQEEKRRKGKYALVKRRQ